jgi:hypothetical protein
VGNAEKAKSKGYQFEYLYDESRDIARKWCNQHRMFIAEGWQMVVEYVALLIIIATFAAT